MSDLKLQRQTKTAQYFTESLPLESGIDLDMILIPEGTFLMGSPVDELERSEFESPQHKVTVRQFFMSRYPVTQGQWQFAANLPVENRDLEPDPSGFKGANRPVERVTWRDAVEFCERLSRYSQIRYYRLPTEAEWEYACRAGTTTPFYFGQTLTTEVANYDGRSVYGNGLQGKCRQETTLVDHFGLANAFGLCDMHGNVFEWCLDEWHQNYEGAPANSNAWISSGESKNRVYRGGSWLSDPRYCRSAFRDKNLSDNRSFLLGFRVVCAVL
ncbi:formylglycine-generating enzyme family protein [Leptothoe sp. LEGE 181152]|nr:formylglycine-generating enzyme family protein [Leptothoe sp. LEGE 181152]